MRFCAPAVRAAAIGALALSRVALAGESEQVPNPTRHRASAALALGSWSDAGDLQSPLPGSFDDTALGLDLGGHFGLIDLGPARLMLGGDLGYLGFDSSVRGIEEGEDLVVTMLRVTPSLRLAFGTPGRFQAFVGAGAGWYAAAVEEYEDAWFGDVFEYYDDDAFGAYLSLDADLPVNEAIRITAGLKAHFVDFAAVATPVATGPLDGPIYQLQLGVAFGFGR
jgi:hypothetical protein